MPPVPQTPPAQSLGPQFVPVKRDSKEVDNGPLASNLDGNKLDPTVGEDNRFIKVRLTPYVSEIVQKPEPVDTVAAPPPKLPGLVPVSYRSPSPSDFGANDGKQWPRELPENILKYLDDHNWEAHYVVADGNCLYRALTYGPEWSKHDLARQGVVAHVAGLKQSNNYLGVLVKDNEVKEIAIDGAWESMETGQLQLKAAAEAFRVNIDFVDGDKLQRDLEKPDGGNVLKDKVETWRFGPTPLLTDGEAEPVEPRFGPDKATTLFLWKDHYYPLFPKGSLPNFRRIPNHPPEAQVASPSSEPAPPLSSGSDTRINDDAGLPTIGKMLDTITKHQASLSEPRLRGKSEPPPAKGKMKSPSESSSKLTTTNGVRPGKEHWDPYHDSLVLYKGKSETHLEELPPQPFNNDMEKGVNSMVEQTGMNGWMALGLGAVVATLVAVGGALGLNFWRRLAQSASQNERRARDVNYYSDGDDEFDVRAKW